MWKHCVWLVVDSFISAANVVVCYTAVFIVVTQHSSPVGGALLDDLKNGCVADYECG